MPKETSRGSHPGPATGPQVDQPRQLRARHAAGLWAAASLAVVPSLPFVQSEATAFVRFHNWALFVAGLILGRVLTSARAALG
jgi:hypothetical protein